MLAVNQRPKRISAAFFTVLCLAMCYQVDSQESQDTQPTVAVAAEDTFTVMDVEMMSSYRDERRAKIIAALRESELSTEHQELIAIALSKTFVGVPVCSFTHTELEEGMNVQKPSVQTSDWVVRDLGHVISKREPFIQKSLNSQTPFPTLPLIPFDSKTGEVLRDDDTTATFKFNANVFAEVQSEDSMLGDLAQKMSIVFEVTVNKEDQSPKLLLFKLDKPVRKRFLFKLKSFEVQMHYSYIDSCDSFGMSHMLVTMEASALFAGRVSITNDSSFSNISCREPKRFLLPENDENFQLNF